MIVARLAGLLSLPLYFFLYTSLHLRTPYDTLSLSLFGICDKYFVTYFLRTYLGGNPFVFRLFCSISALLF